MWQEYKKRKIESLNRAIERGEVDEWIVPILKRINENPDYVTLSSCAGRLAVMDMKDFGNKGEATFLGKWHEIPEESEVLRAIEAGRKTTWLMLHPPILHIACRDLKSAEKLLIKSQRAGIRRAGIISLKNFVVEVCGHERMEIPVRFKKALPLDLSSVLEIAKMKLDRSRKKFLKLSELFVSD